MSDRADDELPRWPEELRPGVVTDVAPGVQRVVAPNPGMMTGPGTNTYVVGSGRLALVDPGPDNDDHLATLVALYGDRVGWILVTHTHTDHAPLARRLKGLTGAEVVGFGPPPRRSPGGLDAHDEEFRPDRVMGDGDRLDLGDCGLEAVHTPGHSSNHLCFELAGAGLLFSGDHVMSGSTVVIAPPDGDMAAYLESLEKVRRRGPRRIAPGHGAMIDRPEAVLDEYLRHRREREGQVLAHLAAAGPDGVTAEQLVEAIYTGVPVKLHPVARYSVWAHLLKLGAEGRADSTEPTDPDAPWRPGDPASRSGRPS